MTRAQRMRLEMRKARTEVTMERIGIRSMGMMRLKRMLRNLWIKRAVKGRMVAARKPLLVDSFFNRGSWSRRAISRM